MLSYDKLTAALELRFGDAHKTQLLHGQLHSRVQLSKESLTEFAQEIEGLARKAFANCPVETQDLVAVRQFVEGIADLEIQKVDSF